MEGITWLTHRYVMHGFLWYLHEDHHQPTGHFFEKNDAFFLIFAIPSMACIFYGNCQVIYNVYDVLNSIPEFRDQYKSIRYVNHDRDQTRELSNINIVLSSILFGPVNV
jgi:hypothetical protein